MIFSYGSPADFSCHLLSTKVNAYKNRIGADGIGGWRHPIAHGCEDHPPPSPAQNLLAEDLARACGVVLDLVGAVFWAGHVCLIGWLSPRMRATQLACGQYAVCGALSLATAGFTETITVQGLSGALYPILYGGLLSVGLAYTLQVVAQRDAKPAHAAILLSLEAVFAALAGWLLLDESMGSRGLFGCTLMMAGMLASQLWPKGNKAPVVA